MYEMRQGNLRARKVKLTTKEKYLSDKTKNLRSELNDLTEDLGKQRDQVEKLKVAASGKKKEI